jgi:hypothetical protein
LSGWIASRIFGSRLDGLLACQLNLIWSTNAVPLLVCCDENDLVIKKAEKICFDVFMGPKKREVRFVLLVA